MNLHCPLCNLRKTTIHDPYDRYAAETRTTRTSQPPKRKIQNRKRRTENASRRRNLRYICNGGDDCDQKQQRSSASWLFRCYPSSLPSSENEFFFLLSAAKPCNYRRTKFILFLIFIFFVNYEFKNLLIKFLNYKIFCILYLIYIDCFHLRLEREISFSLRCRGIIKVTSV